MTIGFRAFPRVDTDLALAALFGSLPTSNVSDCMSRLSGPLDVVPRHRAGAMRGIALTVRVRQGDNLMIHRALQMGKPGDVLVVDGGGVCDRALVGEIMKAVAVSRGFVGFVIDGAIRDLQSFAEDDFPCYSRGVSHRGPYKYGPGEINVPVCIGGAVVNPGDVVLGDRDGVLFVPPHEAKELAEAAHAKMASEIGILKTIASGQYDDAWIAKNLKENGVQ
jgi:regulator of RNase E activity RraA